MADPGPSSPSGTGAAEEKVVDKSTSERSHGSRRRPSKCWTESDAEALQQAVDNIFNRAGAKKGHESWMFLIFLVQSLVVRGCYIPYLVEHLNILSGNRIINYCLEGFKRKLEASATTLIDIMQHLWIQNLLCFGTMTMLSCLHLVSHQWILSD